MDPLTVVALAALIGYALIGIGSPLLGWRVFAATDLLTQVSPYRDAGIGGAGVQNTYLNDTIDAYLPNIHLYVSGLRDGQLAAWNPYIVGGVPLGASTNLGLANPIAFPYLVLPIWLAPGYVKLLEIAVAAGGTFLFARRIGLGRPAALLGGLVFASSGFMVAWTNWPHTRVAAFIPVLFWALERLATRRRVSDGVLVSGTVAAMIFGGFPAVAGYGLLFGGLYLAVRTVAEHHGQWRRALGVLLGAVGAALAGVALTAVQLAPFLSYMSSAYVTGREQSPSDHLLPETLVTALAPWALGSTDPSRPPPWNLHVNLVESLVYVGAAALVLVVTALSMPRAGRALTSRGTWLFLVLSAGTLLLILYVGRAPLAALQQLPVLFSENFVGRARSVLGFLLAVLAAIGFQLLLARSASPGSEPHPAQASSEPGPAQAGSKPRWTATRSWFGPAVWLGAVLAGALAWWDARRAAYATSAEDPVPAHERVAHLDQQMLIGVGLVLLCLVLVAILRWGGRPVWGNSGRRVVPGGRLARLTRFTAAALLPALIAGQALALAGPYWPRAERETFFPVTDTHRFLAKHLGHERFAGSGRGMYVGADSAHRLRALTGHFFLSRRFAETVDGLPGRQFGDPPTYLNFPVAPQVVSHPVLDRLSVKYFVAGAEARVLGKQVRADGDGTVVTLRPERSSTAPYAVTGPVRALGLIPAPARPRDGASSRLGDGAQPAQAGPTDAAGPNPAEPAPARLEVVLRDESGAEVARAWRLLSGLGTPQGLGTPHGLRPGAPLWIPIAAEHVPAHQRLSVQLRWHGSTSLRVRGIAGDGAAMAAISVVRPRPDGLRLAYAGSAVVYERLTALPRIRWAARARAEPDPARRVAVVASGELAPDEVVLDKAPGEAMPSGVGPPDKRRQRAEITVLEDGPDAITISVAAAAPGHLVVADALQSGWAATVDGATAELVPADHGLVATPVRAGAHIVRLQYRMPFQNAGAWITGLTFFILTALVSVEIWRRRRGARIPRPEQGRTRESAECGFSPGE